MPSIFVRLSIEEDKIILKKGVFSMKENKNEILKDYMLKGYAVNKKRLEYLEKTVKLIDIANRIDERLEGNDAKETIH